MYSRKAMMKGNGFRYCANKSTSAITHYGSTLLILFALVLGGSNALAQFQPSYDTGMGVAPAYEGWVANPDGSYTMLFGYMNDNWDEELNIPISSENSFSPGPADRGQPTYFLPRRNRNVFGIQVPADFEGELVWTLIKGDGVTQKAYGSLLTDYVLEPITIMSEAGTVSGGFNNSADVQTNEPPMVSLVGEKSRTIRVGQPLQLEASVVDDGKPNVRTYRRGLSALDKNESPQEQLEQALTPPIRGTVDRVVGMYFSWFVYRGSSEVTFEPLQVKTWEDTRAFQNSPWAPFWDPPVMSEDGIERAEVTFHEPGDYILRGLADDGGLTSDVELTVRVIE